jgi:N-methylhydantoinase A
MTSLAKVRLAIDTGGTFTDVVALDQASGQLTMSKTPTTPADPSVGFINAVRKVRQQSHTNAEIGAICHGTTIATNALLHDEFPGLALVVTRGFKHLLEIARQSVPQSYGNSYFWVKPERIVPLHHVCEVDERMTFEGQVMRPFDDAGAEEVADWLRQRGLSSIGVCFLHAYANGEHERRMRDILQRVYPDVAVSISSEVLPEYREYERAVTTLVDAFVKPRVGRYIGQIEQRLQAELPPGVSFYVMKSNGGVMSARDVHHQPITTVLSGPAAGCLGAALIAATAGFDRVLTLDGGGTSTDVCLVDRGVPSITTEGRVGRHPIKVPMIDIVTVGTGGGSIARYDASGRLRVGPTSAGADPGPVCYARGGTEPTVTDAAIVLGHLPPRLLGGEIPLNVELAQESLEALASRAKLPVAKTAAGILELAAWSQANAIRQVTVRRGLDVRDYALVAFGGSGPLQAGRLLDILNLSGALVPPSPGTVSAFGLLTADLRNDFVVTFVQRDTALDVERVSTLFAELEQQARAALLAEGFPLTETIFVRGADLRYFGQASEVRVDVPGGAFDRTLADVGVERFHTHHERMYGYCYRNVAGGTQHEVEWVNLRLTGIGPIRRPEIPRLPSGDSDIERAIVSSRPVYFDDAFVETSVFDRGRMSPGDRLSGPAIVEEYGSTTVIPPRLHASVDDWGNLLITPEAR